MRTISLFFFTAICGLTFAAWSTDSVTVEGRWTVYTARCENGRWDGTECTGKLVAAEQHRFVAEPKTNEVAFEVTGSPSVVGKLSQCVVTDGRNWVCQKCDAAVCPVTRALTLGEPKIAPEGTGDVRPVSKLKWFRLMLGG